MKTRLSFVARAWSGLAMLTIGYSLPTQSCAALPVDAATASSSTSWKSDPAWFRGKAEWAVYEAQREIYGKARHYDATIFTNRQHMDSATTTKASDHTMPGAIAVFKQNVSEIIPTDNYQYRFLTTAFIRADSLEPYKVVVSTQEDCGASYKQFIVENGQGDTVEAIAHVYFPNAGTSRDRWPLPDRSERLRFHDDLTLSLRDFPFDDPTGASVSMTLIPDQTDPRRSPMRPDDARIHYEGRETLEVPYGRVEVHHLRVTHATMGGMSESHYWFADDSADLRRVLVQFRGPYGVEYRLKRLDWWAYWSDPKPE